MPETTDEKTEEVNSEVEQSDPLDGDWHETDHERVFYVYAFGRGEIEDAKEYAERFNDWYIVVTCGPYRSHDVSYTIRPDHDAIHLDYYSVRPGVGYVDEMGDEIRRSIEELRENGVLDNKGE